MSRVLSEESFLVSTDLGFMRVDTKNVEGYDIEDLVRGRAVSLARKIQFQNLAPTIDRSKPVHERTLKSAFLSDLEQG